MFGTEDAAGVVIVLLLALHEIFVVFFFLLVELHNLMLLNQPLDLLGCHKLTLEHEVCVVASDGDPHEISTVCIQGDIAQAAAL